MIDLRKNNVRVLGSGRETLVFAHGYGCDQNMWRLLVPQFAQDYRIVLFDYVGHGRSDLSAFDPGRYASLEGYATDVIDICDALGLRRAIFVGHSVSAMIGVIAARRRPELFSKLVLIGPSPRYIDDGSYRGGFSQQDIDGLLDALDANHLGWSSQMAPVIMGNADRPELGEELFNSFCRTDPQIAKHFARVTFNSDNRADLSSVVVPALIIQCSDDAIAGESVGRYVHDNIPGSRFSHIEASGHCPHLSAPNATGDAMRSFFAHV
ncbi:MAG: alpha/beta hydrolase [Steroidobacteraceae bacterium]